MNPLNPFQNLGGKHPILPERSKEDPVAVQPETEERSKPTVIMTEIDAQLHEIISAQPSSIEEAVSHVVSLSEDSGLHRLSLPEFFEPMSYDCTRGHTCRYHIKEEVTLPNGVKTTRISNPGKYVFRWILKDKRAIDYARTVRGWSIVSRVMGEFRNAPKTLFSVHGGVEIGDDVLAVITVERALRMRRFPGDLSRERLRGQITPTKKAGKVLMTGDPEREHIYEPVSTATKEGEEEVPGSAPGGIEFQEGRDF